MVPLSEAHDVFSGTAHKADNYKIHKADNYKILALHLDLILAVY